MRVLLVEDDYLIGDSLSQSLKDEGYAIYWVRDGQHALLTMNQQVFDIILLDLSLPNIDGMQLLTTLRKQKNITPVLILTAHDTPVDRVKGLDAGADDYLIKPFDLDELLARIRVLIRRSQGQADNTIQVGLLNLDINRKKLTLQDDIIELTAKEYQLLKKFMLSPDKIFSRVELEDSLYGWGLEVESNAIDYLINQLRKKIGHQMIKNVRGLGWYISSNSTTKLPVS